MNMEGPNVEQRLNGANQASEVETKNCAYDCVGSHEYGVRPVRNLCGDKTSSHQSVRSDQLEAIKGDCG